MNDTICDDTYLCTLVTNEREIHVGDTVYRTELKIDRTAKSVFTDFDGDEYLEFEEGGNAWLSGPGDYVCKLR